MKLSNIKRILIALSFLTFFNFSYSQTNVSGWLFDDTNWNIKGSPYIVTEDIAVFDNKTLTIDPGVIVKFETGKKMILNGSLIANGTSDSLITFTSTKENPIKRSWAGIQIKNNVGGKMSASYIKGQYADSFIKILSSSSGLVLNLKNSTIEKCQIGIDGDYEYNVNYTVIVDSVSFINNTEGYMRAKNAIISNCYFSGGDHAVHGGSSSNTTLRTSEITNTSDWAIIIGDGILEDCYIHKNNIGVRFDDGLIIKNNIISNNDIGIQPLISGSTMNAQVFDNMICNNITYNLRHIYGFSVNIGENCFCSNDYSLINETILDGFDDVNLGFVSYSNSCEDSLITNVLNESFTEELGIYPNPTINKIHLSAKIEGGFIIYALNGKVVQQGRALTDINISNLPSGTYLINLFDDNNLLLLSEILIKEQDY